MENEKITFDGNGFANATGFVNCSCTDENHVYIGEQKTQVIFGCGLPSRFFLDKPNMKAQKNEAIIRCNDEWIIVSDFRGQVFYSKENGSPMEIKNIGTVSDELTNKERPSQFHEWLDNDWVLREEKKIEYITSANQAHKASLLAQAKEQIEILQDEVDLDIADDKEEVKALLKNWKLYRIKINKIKDLAQENVDWDEIPE